MTCAGRKCWVEGRQTFADEEERKKERGGKWKTDKQTAQERARYNRRVNSALASWPALSLLTGSPSFLALSRAGF